MIAGLPYDAEVEYVESTGTQWNDTGFVATNGCVIECYFCALETGPTKVIAGSHSRSSANNYNRNQIIINDVRRVDFNKCEKYGGFSTSVALLNSFHEYYFNSISYNRIGKVDGVDLVSETTGGVLSPDTNVLLLMNQYDNSKTSGRVAWCKIYDSGNILVRDFIPVRFTNELGQSEGAMYDRVSKKLFRNQGTGSFVTGPDVAVPVMGLHFMRSPMCHANDYVQAGLVAMFDGIENAGWGTHSDTQTIEWHNLVDSSTYLKARVNNNASQWEWDSNFGYIISDRYILSANGVPNYFISLASDVTLRCCFKVPDTLTTNNSLLCGFVSQNAARHYLGIMQYDGKIYVQHQINANGATAQRSEISGISLGSDCTIDIVWSANDRTAKAYLDGIYSTEIQIANENWNDSNWDTDTIAEKKLLSMGQFGWSGYNSKSNAVKYRNIAIYSRAITAAEIAHNHAVDKERFKLT